MTSPARGEPSDPVDLSPGPLAPASTPLRAPIPIDRARPGPHQDVEPESSGKPRRRGPRGPSDLTPRMGFIPGLDGIRAIAIVGVLVYHFTPGVLPGGFVGVDVFFVVSGFLITTLLLREVAQNGKINLGRFWLRRARRLIPALLTVVIVCVALARVLGGDLLVGITRQTVGALTFSTNWVEVAAGSSYFNSTSPQLFVNFWSLAVEEQFYLLWPFLLVVILAVTAQARQRVGIALALAFISASLMALMYVPNTDATRVYYGTDTHAYGLMLGAALAFAWASPHRAGLRHPFWRRHRHWFVGGALIVLTGCMALLSQASPVTFRGGILLASVATVILIAGLLEYGGSWRRVMSLPALSWLGSRSYGLYLWHWPVLIIVATIVPYASGTIRGAAALTVSLLITLAVTEVSYRLIETPIRKHGFGASVRAGLAWFGTPWVTNRTPRIVAGAMVVLLLLTAAALLTAPEKSATQQQIEESEAELAQQADSAGGGDTSSANDADSGAAADSDSPERDAAGEASADPGPAVPTDAAAAGANGNTEDWGYEQGDDGLWVPPGNEITGIGDSLVVTSADGLTYRFPEMNFAAKSNRQWSDATAVVEEAEANGVIRDNIVLHYGTNAGVDGEQARAVIDALGPQRRIVLMNLYGNSTFTPDSNEEIAAIAGEYPNVVVGDWQAAATAAPQTLQSDRVHPDIEGMHVYAEVVAQSFNELYELSQ